MLTLIKNGGYPMLFILAFGFAGLAGAGWYAYRPNARSLGFTTWVALSVLFGTLQGICSDLGAVFMYLAKTWTTHAQEGVNPVAILLEGLGESTSPGILGFAFLAVIALVTGVGRARDARLT